MECLCVLWTSWNTEWRLELTTLGQHQGGLLESRYMWISKSTPCLTHHLLVWQRGVLHIDSRVWKRWSFVNAKWWEGRRVNCTTWPCFKPSANDTLSDDSSYKPPALDGPKLQTQLSKGSLDSTMEYSRMSSSYKQCGQRMFYDRSDY